MQRLLLGSFLLVFVAERKVKQSQKRSLVGAAAKVRCRLNYPSASA